MPLKELSTNGDKTKPKPTTGYLFKQPSCTDPKVCSAEVARHYMNTHPSMNTYWSSSTSASNSQHHATTWNRNCWSEKLFNYMMQPFILLFITTNPAEKS